ncbi:MAG: hypothetical protein NXH75_13485 [Halobacteriovoraceae bacterium]|nr:hypothetical protein [Halobacteriovoraceae bacterium]
MNKILIINLKRFGDIFQTGHLIQTLKESKPGSEFHLLCFDESVRAAKVLKGITRIHTIDRQKITAYYKNSIYSDGLSMNSFQKTIEEVAREGFQEVINYSNDKISTNLTSYFRGLGAETKGISYTSKQTIQYSSPFALILNDVLTQYPYTPYNFNDCYHQINGEFFKTEGGKKGIIKSSKVHDETARNNLDRLRTMKSNDSQSVSIIGIQIAASSKEKSIPEETIIETIKLINKNPKMFPILLTAPSAKEKDAASRINEEFGNRLVSVEADFIALPSVLKNTDLLLTPDTSVKHMADLLEVPSLEISVGPAPFLKQGSILKGSGIISESPQLRIFKEGSEASETILEKNRTLEPEFIFESMKLLLGMEDASPTSSTHCLYTTADVVDGTWHKPIAGSFDSGFEVKRALGRATIQKVVSGIMDENMIEMVLTGLDRKEVQAAIEEEKTGVSIVTKDLLSTLRGLIQTQENNHKVSSFVENLEKLLSRCFEAKLAAIPTLIFRAKIESLISSSMEENFKEVEGLLYNLKDDLQSCLFVFKRFEEIGYGIKKPVSKTQATTTERKENTL